jgi:uncharacterized protein YecE (DUF72 family)
VSQLRIGTSAFTAAGWPGSFYPKGLPERDYLSYYATRFDTVEVDSTFYRCPPLSTVQGWNAKTPKGFMFAAKVPQLITHEKVLCNCDPELSQFLRTMDALGCQGRSKTRPLGRRKTRPDECVGDGDWQGGWRLERRPAVRFADRV